MNYTLSDLIDIEQFQVLQDRLNEIYSFPSAIIDSEGKILTATGWQDICTKFHRVNPESEKECIKSDQYIAGHLDEANPAVSYRCPHGLIDNATPIIIDGIHYGNFFTGQFFIEKPELEFFKGQAEKYGFDETAYLDAVNKVPIWSEEQLNSYLFFIKGLIEVISGIGLKNLRENEANRQIRESEERYRSLFENAGDAMFIVNDAGRFVAVNGIGCDLLGYTEEELLCMGPEDVETSADEKNVRERPADKSQRPVLLFASEIVRKDGAIIPVEINSRVIHFKGEQARISIMRDLTERRRAEEALRVSEERFRVIFNQAAVGIAVVSTDGQWMQVNNKLCDIFGYSGDELINRRFVEIIHPDEGDDNREQLRRLFDGEINSLWLILTYVNRYGIQGWINFNASLVRDAGGTGLYFICVMDDITDRKRVELDLMLSERKLKSIIETIPDLLFRLDPKGLIVFINDAITRYGYAVRDLIGRNILDIIAEEDRKKARYRVTERRTGNRRTSSFEVRIRPKLRIPSADGNGAGTAMPVFLIEAVGLYGGERPGEDLFTGTQIIARDISDRKRMEEELSRSLAEKETLLKELQHRVKNNLGVISSLLYFEMGNLTDENSKAIFQNAISRIQSMAEIYRQLYGSAGLDSIDLKKYLSELARSLVQTYSTGGGQVNLTTDLDDVRIDMKRAVPLGLVLNELISNAVKYAYPAGSAGELRITLRRTDEVAEICVSDDGPGLPAGFDISTVKSMGLKLVPVLVKQIGGTFSLEGGAGTSARITFTP